MKTMKWVALSLVLLLAATVGWGRVWGQGTQFHSAPEFSWTQSLPVSWGSPGIAAIGGTEVHTLVAFDRKLFAAMSYWMDTEAANPETPGAQVLRLDSPGSQWQVDLELPDRTQKGLREYLAISDLEKVRFSTDGAGRQLGDPVDLLLAGVWKRGRGLDILSRSSGSGPGLWSKFPLPGGEDSPQGAHVRAFVVHHDPVVGSDILFVGSTGAIFAGSYDRERRNIVWNPQPEWGDPAGAASLRIRVASFADCDGKLYATSGGTIYQRVDGRSPTWSPVFVTTIQSQNPRVTGLRGLTCIRAPSGPGSVLLVGVEDNPARIYRVDPRQVDPAGGYIGTLELNITSFLTATLHMRTTYAAAPYNHMTEYPDSAGGCSRLLIGLESQTPDAPETFGWQHWDPRAHFLMRNCDGTYALREIRDPRIVPPPELVSVRTIAVSPFPSDPAGTIYAGGFDTNFNAVHNTAWLYKGVPTAVSH